MSFVEKVFSAVAYPNDKEDVSHEASHGPSLVEHQPSEGLLDRLTSAETTRQIQSQGNTGTGMDGGLRTKGIEQQTRVAERSRLQEAGLFEPHMTHDKLTNLDQEHRDVADGSRLVFADKVGTSTSEKIEGDVADTGDHVV